MINGLHVWKCIYRKCGGEIGLRVAVSQDRIKAYSLWAGVVGSYEDMLETYIDDIPFLRNRENPLVREYGLPSENLEFWSAIEPYEFLDHIEVPVQLQHGTNDMSVSIELSKELYTERKSLNKDAEFIEYPGNDHNIDINLGLT